MNVSVHTDTRPEAMADVPGVCELPLTRAVVHYRDVHEADLAGGRIQDIGMALVLEGRYASSAEVVDLGSADSKVLDLSSELVVLDWAYEPTLAHAQTLVGEAALTGERKPLGRFCFRMAMSILERVGFTPLTRPTLLRIGYRDICRDLDLHEGTSVRIEMAHVGVVRSYLDYDANALVFKTGGALAEPKLEEALRSAFPTGLLHRLVPTAGGRSGGYQVRFSLPLDLTELRRELAEIRIGLGALLSRYEPDRYAVIDRMTRTFGARETLSRLRLRSGLHRYQALSGSVASSTETVH